MIFNNNTSYAKVWKVTKPADRKYIELQISTYEKNNEGEYVYSTWFPRVIGHAFNSLANVKEGDNIAITKSKFTNEKYTNKEGEVRSAFRFLILEANIEDKNAKENAPAPATNNAATEEQPANNVTEEDPW